ncbi:MAG: M20 family metallopeptidase [Caldisericia bacterium]|nr:M20 family metallopeptidase [Caldisericia bacterium]
MKDYKSCSGISAIIGKKDGKVIAIRSDMDALPIKEETGLPYSSKNENMHACGHDGHMAIVLGVAKVLKKYEDKLNGKVKFIFQPGEEKECGAKLLIDEGILENPKVDAILGIHVGNFIDEIENGVIGLYKGPFMASIDSFKILVLGKGTHGATPHRGVDPIYISSQIVLSIQEIISREIEVFSPSVISFGKISGGTSYNVIPELVEIEGTVRTLDENIRVYVRNRMEEIISNITKSFRGNYKFEYHFGYPVVVNDPELTDRFYEITKMVVDENKIKFLKKPTMVGEDFSYYTKNIPGLYIFLSSKKVENPYPHHNTKFDIDERVLPIGTLAISNFIINYLK